MIKKMMRTWQAWLDKIAESVPLEPETAPDMSKRPDFFGAPPSVLQRPETVWSITDAVADNRAMLALRTVERDIDEALSGLDAPGGARPYEIGMGPEAAALLRELDEAFELALIEQRQRRAVALAEQQRRSWFGAMVERRSARNQAAAMVDVSDLWRRDVPDEERVRGVVAKITRRARTASDPDAPTGLLPVTVPVFVGAATEEDPDC